MSSEKLAIILDTNILQKGKKAKNDFSELSLDIYYDSMNMIELNDITDQLSVYIPEIVLLELSSHTLDRINDRINQLNEICAEFEHISGINIEGHDSFDSKTHIDRIKDFTLRNVNYIDIPEDWSTLFDKVLEMALYKVPPFERGKGKSDKGFKDAIILLSLVEFAKEEDYTDFVVFSKDQAFKKNEAILREFFHNETNKNLEIQQNDNVTDYISNKYNLSQGLKQYLDEYYSEIEEEISALEKIVLDEHGITCDIEQIDIDFEKTTKTQVNPDEHDLFVSFKVVLDCENEISEINDLSKTYTFKKENNDWKVEEKEFNYQVF
ncbi:hypothetical protein JCM15415_08610 [Methanobacterium movens]